MKGEEEEELCYFWEVDNSIYDNDGDLLVMSLLWMYVYCIEEAFFITYEFYDLIEDEYKEKSE